MNPSHFFGESKRRNVYKVAVAYGVVGWLLIQLASILFPTFEAPAWVIKCLSRQSCLASRSLSFFRGHS